MNILFVTAEVAPFSTVGGLSQVMYFLPRALNRMGHNVRIFTAKYGSIEEKNRIKNLWKFQTVYEGLRVPLNPSNEKILNGKDKEDFLICNVKYFRGKKEDLHVYFLENREYYELRANVFGYSDDHIRFGLLSAGCLEYFFQCALKDQEEWWPDVIHCNDWHTGYLVEWIRQSPRYKDVFAKTAVVFTVHNFAYQGNFDFRYAPAKEKDNGVKPLASIFSPDFQRQNPVLRGIRMADAISTVSPTHAIEVLTPQFGEGLDEELVKARGKLTGILNGLDTKEFNPATDPIITKNYSERSFINARLINKKALQKLFSLPLDEKAPLFISCGRLSMQKGWDILLQVLPHLFVFRKDAQLIVLGSGDQGNYREKLKALQEEFPGQVGLHLRGDFRLPRKLYAGGDMILIPSLFEPGGIVALEALRYGCIPIVSRTGGLNDIIIDYSPRTMEGNGFSFSNQDPWALFGTISRALAYFDDARLWHQLVKNALMCDFSWEHSAKEYDHWYEQVVEVRKRAISETPHPAYEASV